MRVEDPERIIKFPGCVDGIGVQCVQPVGVQTRAGRTLTGAACMADLTVQEYAQTCSRKQYSADALDWMDPADGPRGSKFHCLILWL